MQTVFVMVKCELGQAYTVAAEAIEKRALGRSGGRFGLLIDQASEIHSISGQFDLLMKFYLNDDQDIGHFITQQVQLLPGVKDTFTLITFKAFS